MASSLVPLVFTSATVATAGVSVAAGTAVPDNCHTIHLYNASETETVYFALDTAGNPLTSTTSGVLPPEKAIALTIGALGLRAMMDDLSDLVFDASGNGPIVHIIYECGIDDYPQVTKGRSA